MSRQHLLDQYLARWRDRRFDWKSANCAVFVSGWVETVTGVNPMLGVAPACGRLDAHRRLRELGGMAAAVSLQLGEQPINAAFAQCGDVVLVEDDEAQALGICCGRTAALLTEEDGLAFVPISYATQGWRVRCG